MYFFCGYAKKSIYSNYNSFITCCFDCFFIFLNREVFKSSVYSKKTQTKEEIAEHENEILKGIDHYELEYYSSYPGKYNYIKGVKNYDTSIEKYAVPIKTTIKELKKDFPFDETSKSLTKSVQEQSINLEDDTEVWVYVTCKDNYNCDLVRFTYDKLELSENELIIKTHFETIERVESSTTVFRLVVVSVIPVNQV